MWAFVLVNFSIITTFLKNAATKQLIQIELLPDFYPLVAYL